MKPIIVAPVDVNKAWLASKSLAHFIRQAAPNTGGCKSLAWNWHLDAVCEHLEAISRGEIRRLMIWIPPRFLKSYSVSVFWPAWEWLVRPQTQFLTASYKAPLAIRDAVRCRSLMLTPWYQRTLSIIHEGKPWDFASDQNVKSRYENNRGGHRIAIGVGTGTGEDADIRSIDDAHNVTDVESDTRREAVINWANESWSTRGNDPLKVRDVYMGQRTHEQDLQGQAIDREGRDTEGGEWTVLDLPMRYEPTTYVTVLGFRDPRTEAGQLLFPERWPESAVVDLERRLGPSATAAQLQQRPTPKGGAMAKEAWFGRRWRTLPEPEEIKRAVWYFDLSFGAESKGASFNAGHLWIEWEGPQGLEYLLADRLFERGGTTVQDAMLHEASGRWKSYRPALIVENKANGRSAVERLQRVIPGLDTREPVKGNVKDRKEVAFAATVVPLAAAGQIVLPADDVAPWAVDVLRCWVRFPRVKPDDDADAASGALWELWGGEQAPTLAAVQLSSQDIADAVEQRRALIRELRGG